VQASPVDNLRRPHPRDQDEQPDIVEQRAPRKSLHGSRRLFATMPTIHRMEFGETSLAPTSAEGRICLWHDFHLHLRSPNGIRPSPLFPPLCYLRFLLFTFPCPLAGNHPRLSPRGWFLHTLFSPTAPAAARPSPHPSRSGPVAAREEAHPGHSPALVPRALPADAVAVPAIPESSIAPFPSGPASLETAAHYRSRSHR